MGWMPNMVYGDRIRQLTQIQFGCYDHRIGAADGRVWYAKNMSSPVSPLMDHRTQ